MCGELGGLGGGETVAGISKKQPPQENSFVPLLAP